MTVAHDRSSKTRAGQMKTVVHFDCFFDLVPSPHKSHWPVPSRVARPAGVVEKPLVSLCSPFLSTSSKNNESNLAVRYRQPSGLVLCEDKGRPQGILIMRSVLGSSFLNEAERACKRGCLRRRSWISFTVDSRETAHARADEPWQT